MDSKIEKCKYSFPQIGSATQLSWYCEKNKSETNCEACEKCKHFDSRYIEYPIEVSNIVNNPIDTNPIFHKCGDLCRITPCTEEYKGKTFLGIYIGDLPIFISSAYNTKTKDLTNTAVTNPAIFVPELKKIIYGNESWWAVINDISELKDITQEEIDSQWYVQLLKSLN